MKTPLTRADLLAAMRDFHVTVLARCRDRGDYIGSGLNVVFATDEMYLAVTRWDYAYTPGYMPRLAGPPALEHLHPPDRLLGMHLVKHAPEFLLANVRVASFEDDPCPRVVAAYTFRRYYGVDDPEVMFWPEE